MITSCTWWQRIIWTDISNIFNRAEVVLKGWHSQREQRWTPNDASLVGWNSLYSLPTCVNIWCCRPLLWPCIISGVRPARCSTAAGTIHFLNMLPPCGAWDVFPFLAEFKPWRDQRERKVAKSPSKMQELMENSFKKYQNMVMQYVVDSVDHVEFYYKLTYYLIDKPSCPWSGGGYVFVPLHWVESLQIGKVLISLGGILAHLSLSHGQYNLWVDRKVYAQHIFVEFPCQVVFSEDVSLRFDMIHVHTSRSFSPWEAWTKWSPMSWQRGQDLARTTHGEER